MKHIILLLFICFSVAAKAQLDTVVVENKTYTGSAAKNYADRITFNMAGTNYMVYKSRINNFNIRSKTVVNGIDTFVYVSSAQALNTPNLPQFRDTKFYLRRAGIMGITGTVSIFTGVALGIVGIARQYNGGVAAGIMFITAGFTCYIPMGVFLLKAGKVKPYKEL